jgi:hypothetical protein
MKLLFKKNSDSILSFNLGSQNNKLVLHFFQTFSNFFIARFWLNYLMDDCPFSYITKLKRNKCCCGDITYTFIKMALVSNKIFNFGGKK